MFYEIRHYKTEPGRRDEWVHYMENVVIPYQQSKGMTVTASFVADRVPRLAAPMAEQAPGRNRQGWLRPGCLSGARGAP